jgi:hypothetical protein
MREPSWFVCAVRAAGWLTVALTALVLTACGCDCDKQPVSQPTTKSLVQFRTNSELGPWQEEVKLRDGRVIVIERLEAANVRSGMGDVGAAFITNTTISFMAPPELAILPVLSLPYRPVS